MTQMIYAISALGIVVVFSVSMQTSSNSGDQTVYRNETLTQLVSIGRDIVDEIARQDMPFDQKTDPTRIPQPATYPYVHTADELTPAANFGGCTNFADCRDLDDFDGMPAIEGERNGLDYSATIEVRYVAEEDPSGEVGNQTFAKEIIVTVESPSVRYNGDPISASYSRVITYPRITNYSY